MNIIKLSTYFAMLIIAIFPVSSIAVIQVPDVVVKAKQNGTAKTKAIIKDVSAIIVTKKQKDKIQPKNVSELLQKTTNVVIQQTDAAKAGVSMRGFGDNAAQNVLIMLNGQPLVNPDLGVLDINLLPVASIERIEIMPNSFGVLYGDQAVAGIINIMTQSPQKDFAKVNASYGSFNTYDLGAEMAKSFANGFGYDVNVGHFISDHYRDHNQERKNHAAVNLNYHKNNTDAYLEYENIGQRLQLAGVLTQEQMEENRQQAKNDTDQSNTYNQILLAGISQQLSQHWRVKIDSSFIFVKNDGTVTSDNIPYDFNAKRHAYFLRPEFIGAADFFKWIVKPIVGAELKSDQYTYASMGSNAKDRQTQLAAFGQLSLLLTNKLTLISGIRMANNKDDSGGNTVFPFTLGLNYSLNKHWRFYIRRAGSYRFPKVDENTRTLNNKPLKPQTGVAYELGLSWKQKPITLQMQLFQIELTNEIAYIPFVNTPYGFGYNENLDKTRRQGIMLDLSYAIIANWHISGGYSYVDPKFLSGQYKGNMIPDVSRNIFNISTDYTFRQNWQLFFNVNYIGKSYPNNDIGNQQSIAGYTLLNAGISYKYKKVQLTAKINNITNKKYSSTTMMSYDVTGAPELKYYPAAGINGEIALTVQL